MAPRVGIYPGSFNPLTTAHLAIAASAREERALERVVLAFSRRPIDKEHIDRPRFDDRVIVARAEAATHGWLDVIVTESQLLVDIARGYDLLIMGADKWRQVIDPKYYASEQERDAAVAALPELAIAPRPPLPVPLEHLLQIDVRMADVSSTRAREGNLSMMCEAARTFDRETGAWTDPDRYERYLLTS